MAGTEALWSSSLLRPVDIVGDRQDNVCITDSDNHGIRRWNRTTEGVERLAGRQHSASKFSLLG
ncbi:MAG: hypothetical protein NNA23_02115 [Nitrospira sp.]|nr:hypothetical protein [Nitrospira sp.]